MSSSPSSDGGCPFLCFDEEKLLKCLHHQVNLEFSWPKNAKNEESAKEACHMYLRVLQNDAKGMSSTMGINEEMISKQNPIAVLSPSQFYFTVKTTQL